MDAAELAYAGAARQARLVADGTVSARELVQTTLDRIAAVDPALNAFRATFAERALIEADQADARRAAGDDRPLLGVPVAVKDDVDVAGEVTARGTLAHEGAAVRDGAPVARLRAAGAIVVGKTNVPELMLWPFTESPSFGATRNPWDPAFSPGGSSGGSGAAAAAGLCGVAFGSDGLGSIRIPASFCGVFGLKPQRERVPVAPARELCQGLAVHGTLSRGVADAALALDVLAATGGTFGVAAARTPGPLRIALATAKPPGALGRLGDAQRRAVEETAARLRGLGHDVRPRELDLPATVVAHLLVRYLRGAHDEVRRVARPERLERRTRTVGALGARIPAPVLARVRAAERAIAARVDRVFADADVVLMPGPSGPPFRVGAFEGHGAVRTLVGSAAKIPWYGLVNATGHPAASVPAGFDAAGLPLSIQLVGRPSDEATLLSLAAQLEAERPWADRKPIG